VARGKGDTRLNQEKARQGGRRGTIGDDPGSGAVPGHPHVDHAARPAGIKLWAFGHLLANGDLGGIILFGSFLGWAAFDRISLKRRGDAGGPPIPVGGVTNDIIAVVIGIVAYLALAFAFHPVVIGVPVMGS